MAHVILGLLMLWPQSLYDLTKHFEAGLSLIYSSSTGSIKRALDRLLADASITADSEGGPRGRKTYAITDAGRAEFRRWMLERDPTGDPETAMLSRAFFLGLVTPEERVVISQGVRERISDGLRQFQRLEARIATEGVPEEFAAVAQYQLATLQYGLASHRTALAWADAHLPHPQSDE